VVEVAKQVDAKTNEITEVIDKKREEMKQDVELIKTLTKAQATVEATSVKAIEVIIEKHNKGTAGITESDLVKILDEKISNAKEIVKKVEETAKQVVEQKPVETNTVEATKTTEVKVEANSIKPVEINITVTQTAEKTIGEAQELLNNGDLTQAIQKVAETAEITRQAVADAEVTKTTEVENPVVAPIEVNLK
jgi:hypothetical protein